MFEFPDVIEYTAYNIAPRSEDKRIRVFGGQLQDSIIDNTTLQSFNWSIGFYFKNGINLIKKFPHREIELNQIMMEFWRRMQIKFKQLQEK